MSQWSHNHPEEMAEIARLPVSQQNDALRDAVGYDPDRIREEAEERRRDGWVSCSGCGASVLPADTETKCPLCGAELPEDDE